MNFHAKELSLRELREEAGKTQAELAKKMGVTQAAVSRVELHRDHRISTLRKYVKALGGELVLMVLVEGKTFELTVGRR